MSLEPRLRALAELWRIRARGLEASNSSQPARAETRCRTLRECADDLCGVLEEKKP
jgi:hypothetical protein